MSSMDKVAVVTGGASGIGEGCVRKLVSLGYLVEILDQEREQSARLVNELNSSSPVSYTHLTLPTTPYV